MGAEKRLDRTPHGVDTDTSHQRVRCLEGDASAEKASTSRRWRGMNVLYGRDRMRDVAWLLAFRQAECSGLAAIRVRPPTLPHSFCVCKFVALFFAISCSSGEILMLEGAQFAMQLSPVDGVRTT